MLIPKSGHIHAFSMIIDINGFAKLVDSCDGNLIGDFVRDTLIGSVTVIEKAGGDVVGVMGDAIFGVLPNSDSAAEACFMVAKDVNALCEYLAGSEGFPTSSPTLKIGVEFGWLDVSSITTNALGSIPLLIGPATNHAARIIQVGEGNRCHIGPRAVQAGFEQYGLGPVESAPGKKGEAPYTFQRLEMGDIWVEGVPEDGQYFW
jgi:class 3 adenylate cyclase